MNAEERAYLNKLDQELITGELELLGQLWEPADDELNTMSLAELKTYFDDLRKARKCAEVEADLPQVLGSVTEKIIMFQKMVEEGEEGQDYRLESLDEKDGYKAGAYKVVLPNGDTVIVGEHTEEGQRQLLIQRIRTILKR